MVLKVDLVDYTYIFLNLIFQFELIQYISTLFSSLTIT